MPSPVRPNDICTLVPNPSDGACPSLKKIFFEIPTLLCDLVTYFFDSAGNPSDDFLADIGSSLMPPGSVIDFSGLSIPDGWLICNGQAVDRTTYATLFATIGTIWGSGDGVTTFNVPDLQGKFTMGKGVGFDIAQTGGSLAPGLPDHRHGYGHFESGNDNVWLTMEAYTFPETMLAGYVRGDGSSWQGTTTIVEGTEMDDDTGGTNNRPGLKTTIPIPEDNEELSGEFLPPYGVVYKLIKAE